MSLNGIFINEAYQSTYVHYELSSFKVLLTTYFLTFQRLTFTKGRKIKSDIVIFQLKHMLDSCILEPRHMSNSNYSFFDFKETHLKKVHDDEREMNWVEVWCCSLCYQNPGRSYPLFCNLWYLLVTNKTLALQ